MRRRGPLADSYPAAVALVIFALVPFLMLTAAVLPLTQMLSKGLGLSTAALDITIGLSDAGYALGTVLAVQFAVHLPPDAARLRDHVRGGGRACRVGTDRRGVHPSFIVEGLCTSLMLIAAVPPLVTGWSAGKMPVTGSIMNLCIFGAVAVGPTVGGMEAATGSWRPLFWAVAGIAVLALAFALLTFEDEGPDDRSAPWDFVAIALAGGGCTAAFFGAGQLEVAGPGPGSLAPLVAGVAMIGALVVHQYRTKHPLMPVRQIATTFPVAGVVIAMFASSAAFGLMELVLTALQHSSSPAHVALLFLPEFGAAVVTAALFGVLFRTRFTPVLAVSGLAVITAAAAMLTGLSAGGGLLVAAGAALIGFGVGASVSPALFIAGFSLRSSQIQRVFALVELLRGVTAFLVAPILLYLATAIGASAAGGIRAAVWICLVIAAAGGLTAIALFALGGGGLQTPDIARWNEGEPAWDSPPLLARFRGQRGRGGHSGQSGQPQPEGKPENVRR
jgi:hypothetical protein